MRSFSEFQEDHPREHGQPRSEYAHESARAYADEILNEVQYYTEQLDPREALVALCEVIRALHYL